MITAETITDEQIRELIVELRNDGTWSKVRGRLHWSRQDDLRACFAALSVEGIDGAGNRMISKYSKESARARCAEIFNARTKETK